LLEEDFVFVFFFSSFILIYRLVMRTLSKIRLEAESREDIQSNPLVFIFFGVPLLEIKQDGKRSEVVDRGRE
jgi:hypothetical protein